MKVLATFGNVGADLAGIMIAWPGEGAGLGWRIQNSGTCIWDSAYSFEQVDSGQFAADITDSVKEGLKERVAPGKSIAVQFKVICATISWRLSG